MLKRFRRAVSRRRILSTYRKNRWFVSKGEQRRRERERGIRKLRRRQSRASAAPDQRS